MGSMVIATCTCGFEDEVLIGGGMMDFGTKCYFPALCQNCGTMVQLNLLAKRVRCPKCRRAQVTPYDDPELCGEQGRHEVTSWHDEEQIGRVLRLHDGEYKCPACGGFTLHFEDGGLCWD